MERKAPDSKSRNWETCEAGGKRLWSSGRWTRSGENMERKLTMTNCIKDSEELSKQMLRSGASTLPKHLSLHYKGQEQDTVDLL